MYSESIEVIRVFGQPMHKALRQKPLVWFAPQLAREECRRLRNTFNNFVLAVDKTYHRIQVRLPSIYAYSRVSYIYVRQNRARRVRDPDERWCHSEAEALGIRDIYLLPLVVHFPVHGPSVSSTLCPP